MTLILKDVVEFLKRYPLGVVCAVLSALVLVGYYLRNSRVSELDAQLTEVEAQARRILADVENSADLVGQYAAVTKATNELDSRLVRSTDRPRNQQYFYGLELETGVKEINLQQTNGNLKNGAGDFCYGIGYSITVEGSFRQILGFLGRLESGQHFYRLISASLSRQGPSNPSASRTMINLMLNIELLGSP